MSYTYILRIASAKNVLRAEPTIYLLIIGTTCSNQQFNDKKCYSSAYCIQGRIYVANEYPTFARTIWIVCQKLGIFASKLLWMEEKICLFGWETCKFQGKTCKFLFLFRTLLQGVKYLTPYQQGGRDTLIVLTSLEYVDVLLWYIMHNFPLFNEVLN